MSHCPTSCRRVTLSTLSDNELHRNVELARESSRQLTLIFADQTKSFTTTSQCQVLLPKRLMWPFSKNYMKTSRISNLRIYAISYVNYRQLPTWRLRVLPCAIKLSCLFGTFHLFQVMEFGVGAQSQEVRENLSKFKQFLEHFSEANWLGDLIAPEFLEQKELAVKMLAALQTQTRVALPECSVPSHCGRCGQTATKTKGFCDSCKFCQHGYQASSYPNGCPNGCATQQGGQRCDYCRTNSRVPGGYCTYCERCCHGQYQPCPNGCSNAETISILPKDATSFYDGLAGGSSSVEKLEDLVKMSEALLNAFRHDVAARKAADKERLGEGTFWKAVSRCLHKDFVVPQQCNDMIMAQGLEKKMGLLKAFAEAANEVPEVRRERVLGFISHQSPSCFSGTPAIPTDPGRIHRRYLSIKSLGVGLRSRLGKNG